jgi:hypothetical protein
MKKVFLLIAAFAFGAVALPAHAADSTGLSAPLCKKHKKKRHGKKKASAAPAKTPSSNI